MLLKSAITQARQGDIGPFLDETVGLSETIIDGCHKIEADVTVLTFGAKADVTDSRPQRGLFSRA
jgi:hypothetical protein